MKKREIGFLCLIMFSLHEVLYQFVRLQVSLNEVLFFFKGGDLLSVKLHCPNGSPITAEVVDNDDGTYTASFTPVSRGDHQITIYARGKPIQGNPFDLQACLLRFFVS